MPNTVQKPKRLDLTRQRLRYATAGLLLIFAVVNLIAAVKEGKG